MLVHDLLSGLAPCLSPSSGLRDPLTTQLHAPSLPSLRLSHYYHICSARLCLLEFVSHLPHYVQVQYSHLTSNTTGVGKRPVACLFRTDRFGIQTASKTGSEIFTCERQSWTTQMRKISAEGRSRQFYHCRVEGVSRPPW